MKESSKIEEKEVKKVEEVKEEKQVKEVKEVEEVKEEKQVKEVEEVKEEKQVKEVEEAKEEKEEKEEKNEKKVKEEKGKKELKSMDGDIDFLLPNVSPEELENVLENKDLAPFIFYGNINKKKNSDLIGEIKENIATGDKKHIKQFEKYKDIIKLSETKEKICKKFGPKKENQKILVYVFNNSYNEYLKKMLIYEAHRKTFIELNE